jgi:pimeloyl-ACP methyl ester carboxylesterase
MRLHCREYGRAQAGAGTLVLLHGLFGSGGNWHGVARRLEQRFHLLVPDLRNHGRSPWDEAVDYPAMAGDVLELLDDRGVERASVVGHSMGGKAAMWLALSHPLRVLSLAPVDIAPVRYPQGLDPVFRALEGLGLGSVSDRAEADRALAASLGSAAVRAYLLQNLVRRSGGWAWRMNLGALSRGRGSLQGFPEVPAGRRFPGTTLFIAGGRSDYLRAEHAAAIRQWFPRARTYRIPQAGHWVYSEAPEPFLRALRTVLPEADA